jgi:hypothetical protein
MNEDPMGRNPLPDSLDLGIKRYVEILFAGGIETFESCEGGDGHSYAEPTVRFHGGKGEGFKALAIAQQHDLPVDDLRRIWVIIDDSPTGPYWELTFFKKCESAEPS